ncbi:methyltransferase domain-containing protein [Engelhardtia mirabilis]|uniref:Ubiquinone biosynthesis O-methyltransferase n=1 Tax=Engelhardtia mirabilis TaxID=2528011 RepID=A0A518BIT2_9BACT|nr:Ubiquinone biosynthesis O-methyltransferase [Planctomycetes bacterium Pla133]QDV01214.1 Ubiquinone biosynthesis O-methyltransferase [Planctomycetes bacterium Pla86]
MQKLLLECGPERRDGWTRVDQDPVHAPDLVAHPIALVAVADGSVGALELRPPLCDLDLPTARRAFAEWRRVLAPGGSLALRTPDAAVAAALVGRLVDGVDQGLAALFGHPDSPHRAGRRWAWTRESLAAELSAAGFDPPRIAHGEDFGLTVTTNRRASVDDPAPIASHPIEAADQVDRAAREVQADDTSGGDPTIVLAWPRYDDPQVLDTFFRAFAGVLSDRDDTVLALLYEPRQDGDEGEVLAAIEGAHGRVLGSDTPLAVGLVLAPRETSGWREVQARSSVRIALASDTLRGAYARLELPRIEDPGQLTDLINGTPAGGAPRGVLVGPGATLDRDLAARAAALHPWFYPVELGDHVVLPGIGSPCSAEYLTSRAANRAQLLVEGVLAAIDMRGARLLDLACNCAFWSSYYARAGATSVFGLEGRERHVEQARLYWEANGFLPAGAAQFVRGNISDSADWAPIRDRGPFDVTLCAGILYHVENYAEILRWAAAVTTGTLIVDTRVQDGPEVLVDEPGDVQFNAIRETRRKVTPNRAKLLAVLRELGFEPQVLPCPFGSALGVDHADDYADGARVTIVAKKVAVAAPTNAGGLRSIGVPGGAR